MTTTKHVQTSTKRRPIRQRRKQAESIPAEGPVQLAGKTGGPQPVKPSTAGVAASPDSPAPSGSAEARIAPKCSRLNGSRTNPPAHAAGRPIATGKQAEPQPGAAKRPARETKRDQIIALLRRSEGVSVEELIAATGWLPHTTRAALSGLRKVGLGLERTCEGNSSRYRIAS